MDGDGIDRALVVVWLARVALKGRIVPIIARLFG
jgi:hypothetical protein